MSLSRALFATLAVVLYATMAFAQPAGGHVQIPLDVYEELVSRGADTNGVSAGWAIGNAAVQIEVDETALRPTAEVTLTMTVEVLVDDWTLVPVLPTGTALVSATAGGRPMQLVPAAAGLGWIQNTRGSHSVRLVYQVDAGVHARRGNPAAGDAAGLGARGVGRTRERCSELGERRSDRAHGHVASGERGADHLEYRHVGLGDDQSGELRR